MKGPNVCVCVCLSCLSQTNCYTDQPRGWTTGVRLPARPDRLCCPPNPLPKGHWEIFSRVNRPGLVCQPSRSPHAEIKNAWSYICTPSCIFMGRCLKQLCLFLLKIQGSCTTFWEPVIYIYIKEIFHSFPSRYFALTRIFQILNFFKGFVTLENNKINGVAGYNGARRGPPSLTPFPFTSTWCRRQPADFNSFTVASLRWGGGSKKVVVTDRKTVSQLAPAVSLRGVRVYITTSLIMN
jgi:hypothetical protein